MRRDRRGVAALFDALMFLAVAAVVSAALLGTLHGARGPPDHAVQEKVEAAHLALLRSTLPGGGENDLTVMELAAAEVKDGTSDRSRGLASEALPLLLPGMGFQWEASWGERTVAASSSAPLGERDIYCSQVEVEMPWGPVVYRLRAWAL